MHSQTIGLRNPSTLGRRSFGQFDPPWKQKYGYRLRRESTHGVFAYWHHIADAASFALWEQRQHRKFLDNRPSTKVLLGEVQGTSMMAESYWSHIADAASVASFHRNEETDALISAETAPEQSSLIDFATFAAENPERLAELLARIRPEWRELFREYYCLHKSQSFLAETHGFIQTRVWQALRIIEQAVGSMIVLGLDPDKSVLAPILEKANVEYTEYGPLSAMIVLYATTQSYKLVAETFRAKTPAIRKIFRPTIEKLLADKDIRTVAVGAYLRSLTHQASLTKVGFSKSYTARLRRIKCTKFDAPAVDESPLISFGDVSRLKEAPWNMFEIGNDHGMTDIYPLLVRQGKKLFSKKPAQIFAPVNAEGELTLGYIFARCIVPTTTRSLTHIRGVAEMSATYKDDGSIGKAVTIPNADVQTMIAQHGSVSTVSAKLGDFVQIKSGEAKDYCGKVIKSKKGKLIVRVDFPSGRTFLVRAVQSSVARLDIPESERTFWGPEIKGEKSHEK
jgi:hypothetical protein